MSSQIRFWFIPAHLVCIDNAFAKTIVMRNWVSIHWVSLLCCLLSSFARYLDSRDFMDITQQSNQFGLCEAVLDHHRTIDGSECTSAPQFTRADNKKSTLEKEYHMVLSLFSTHIIPPLFPLSLFTSKYYTPSHWKCFATSTTMRCLNRE